ncbi:MAG: phosphoribosylformylglycinamidine synthase PurS subunit [Rhodothermales bacterium]|jgi:phosphoribosylformylglycinamidine synthase PurS subunit
MLFHVGIEITLRSSILDPQGKATAHALDQLGFEGIEDVRVGKYVELQVNASDQEGARTLARSACEKLLANQVMEDFVIRVSAMEAA